MENANLADLITDKRKLVDWLEETGIGTVHYFNLLLVKYGSETIVLDENEKILAKVSIFNQDFYKAPFYDAAEQIDDLLAY